jgi:hypothetical protein
MSYCRAKRKDGMPCRAHHIIGSSYCFWHEPLMEERRLRASSKGGRATLEDMELNLEARESWRRLMELQEKIRALRSEVEPASGP